MLARIRTTLYTGQRDTGASAVEYGLLVAGIALVVIAAVFFLGGAVSDSFNQVGSAVSSAG
jgi:pilus assembly protein Flp/PilA